MLSGELVEALVEGMSVAGESARAALSRLYAPSPVKLGAVERWRGDPKLLLGLDDESPLGIAFDMHGAVKGKLLLVAGMGVGGRLASALLRRPEPMLDDHGRAAISEMANIVASSFLNGLARAADLRLMPSVPNMTPNVLAEMVRSLQPASDLAFVAPFTIELRDGVAQGAFVAAPDASGVETLARALAKA